MKKTPLITAALLVIWARLASAAGLNLGWLDCAGLGAGATNRAFACNTNNGGGHMLVGSFDAPAGLEHVNGFQAIVDLQTQGATLSPWWDIGDAPHCRPTSSVGFSADFTAGPFSCLDYFAGAALGGGFYIPFYGGPNRAEMRIGFAIASGFGPIAEGDETYLFKATFNNAKTVGLGSCSGCLDDACIEFVQALVTNDPGLGGTDAKLVNPAMRQYVLWQGAETLPCPPGDPVKQSSWGSIKSLYR